MLAHYTNSLESVANILETGFAWVANRRRLIEMLVPDHDYSKFEPQQFGMVSFVKLAPGEVNTFSSPFGRYGIMVSDDWATRNNAQRVIYVDNEGLVAETLKAIFNIAYCDCKSRIRFPDDAVWNMAFENKAVAASVVGATLWANILQLYEYMEPSYLSNEREWRIVNPDPNYGFAQKRTEEIIKDVSPAIGWAEHVNTLSSPSNDTKMKFNTEDITALICPADESETIKKNLPESFSEVIILHTKQS